MMEKKLTTAVLELLGTQESPELKKKQEMKLANLFTTATKEFLTDENMFQKLIRTGSRNQRNLHHHQCHCHKGMQLIYCILGPTQSQIQSTR